MTELAEQIRQLESTIAQLKAQRAIPGGAPIVALRDKIAALSATAATDTAFGMGVSVASDVRP